MSIRFRKSISLGKGVRLNIGKTGIGVSAGIKGFRAGINSRGVYTSSSIPGTGISTLSYHKTVNNKYIQKAVVDNTLKYAIISCVIGLIFYNSVVGKIFIFASIFFFIKYFTNKKLKTDRLKLKLRNKILNNDLQGCTKIAEKLEALDYIDPDKYYILATYYHQIGMYHIAVKFWEESSRFNGSTPHIMLYANSLIANNEYEKAILILQEDTPEEEYQSAYYNLLGKCFLEIDKYEIAIETFKKGGINKRNLDDDLLDLHYNLGIVYTKINDKSNALKHFNKVLATDMNYKDIEERMKLLS